MYIFQNTAQCSFDFDPTVDKREYFVQLFVALMSVTMVMELEGSSDAAELGKEMLRNRYLFDPTHKAGRK